MQFIDLKKQYSIHHQVIDKAMAEVAASAQYIMGPQVGQLEKALAGFSGVKHGVGMGSGTDALLVALMALGLKPGDEVICPAFTFIATAEVVVLLGGKPVFVDVDQANCLINIESVRQAITDRTVGIIPVDLFGQCADYEALYSLADEHGLWIISDAAQSFGATRNGKRSCSFGHIATTSFFPAKPLGAMGDAGMAFTDDDSLADSMRSILNHGQGKRYRHDVIGLNARLDTLQAAVLLAKFSFFQDEIVMRNQVADYYDSVLGSIKGVTIPGLMTGNSSVWAQYTLKCDRRDELAAHLNGQDIPTAIHYPTPIHNQPVFKAAKLGDFDLPVAEDISRRVMSIPMHPYLDHPTQDRVADSIREFCG